MKTQETVNQCKSCSNQHSGNGNHCLMFKKEPEGCIIYNPFRYETKTIRPSLKSRVWFQMVGIKDIITIAVIIYKMKQTQKDKTK